MSALLIACVAWLSPDASQGDTRVLQPGQTVVDESEPGVVRGTVLDEDERPVGGLVVVLHRPSATASRTFPEPWIADVSAEGVAVQSVATDPRGRFSFEGLAPSRYTVKPRRSSVGGGTAHLVVTREQPTATTTLRISLGGVVAGVVVGPDGAPLKRASVFLAGLDLGDGLNRLGEPRPERVRTGEDGRFVLLGVPRGIVHVQTARWEWGWAPPQVLDMRSERVHTDVRLVLERETDGLAFNGPAGVGIGLDFTPAGPVVERVYEGSPAEAEGVRSLDLIRAVDGRPTRFMTPEEFRSRCRGAADTKVVLSIVRPDGSRHEIEIVRAVDPWGERE